MGAENDLIQKLMISKKIMDKHKMMPRNQNGSGEINEENVSVPEVQEFKAPASNYNIPQEFLMESKPATQMPKTSSKDKILSSKLPDEIKRLMIEHPIAQPNNTQTTALSDDIVEKAARLMNVDASGKQAKRTSSPQPIQENTNINTNSIKQIVRETIEEVLSENGLLVESVSKTNDVFSFKVGKHIFEGKVTKIKKIRD